jgi:hypothetical protein
MRITDLQNLYREKQGLLQRLRTPRKKNNLKGGGGKAGGVGKMRGPGRPKKKTFPNPRAKMGRPRKQTPSAEMRKKMRRGRRRMLLLKTTAAVRLFLNGKAVVPRLR